MTGVEFVPFEELPCQFNPDSGRIVTANQAVVGPSTEPADRGLVVRVPQQPYPRDARRGWIRGRSELADMERILFDNYNSMAPILVPSPADGRAGGDSPRASRPHGMLRQLGLPATRDAGGAQLARPRTYNAVWRHLLMLLFDELPGEHEARTAATGGSRWSGRLLDEPDSPWWDGKARRRRETRDDILSRRCADAVGRIRHRLRRRPDAMAVGRLHRSPYATQPSASPAIGPIEGLFNNGPVEIAGGQAIVNATGWEHAGVRGRLGAVDAHDR